MCSSWLIAALIAALLCNDAAASPVGMRRQAVAPAEFGTAPDAVAAMPAQMQQMTPTAYIPPLASTPAPVAIVPGTVLGDVSTGTSNTPSPGVVGGGPTIAIVGGSQVNAASKAYRWMASVQWNGGGHMCGGRHLFFVIHTGLSLHAVPNAAHVTVLCRCARARPSYIYAHG